MTTRGDDHDETERRMQFVFALRSHGVLDRDVLRAMESIRRDAFLEGIFRDRAHEDTPLPIACGQTISQPSIVGVMTQALALNRRCKVLEIGTGSGYQAAILSRLARRVYTIERHKALAHSARRTIEAMGCNNVIVVHGDGALGLPDQAPFDRILLTCAAEDPPRLLMDQLRPGGIMVLPVGQSSTVQTLLKITRTESGLDYADFGEVRFVPLVEGVVTDVSR